MSLSVALAATLLLPTGADAGSITRIQTSADEITVAFDDIVEEASTFALVGPDRIAIDVKGSTAGQGGHTGGMIRSVRQGQFDPHTARIVLDLDRPAVVTGGVFAKDGRSLKIRFAAAAGMEVGKRQSFLPPAAFRAEPPKKSYSVKKSLGRAKDKLALPPVRGPKDKRRPLVVIDAGHGGHDPGAISPHGSQREKDVTLAIARALRDRLLNGGRVRVALTRDSDKYLVLQERYGIARRLNADLFISIHADAAPNHSASGATVYTLSEVASDREASRLAARENKANIINGVNLGTESNDVSSILIDLTQRETMNISADFAKLLHREGSRSISFRRIPHKFASFVVLKAPDTPSVLFETGYLTNEDDVAFLASRAGQRKLADGMASAIETHFARKLAAR